MLAAGEGIETMLSLRCALPTLPTAAALSANHLAAMLLPSGLRRLYIARDLDAAGEAAQTALVRRAVAAGIEAIALSPRLGDFNEDLHVFGLDALRAALRIQLAPGGCRPFPALVGDCRIGAVGVDRRRQLGRGGPMPERRDHGLLEGDRTAGGPGRQWLRWRLFSAAHRRRDDSCRWVKCALCIAKQNSRPSAILRWRFGPPLSLRVLARPAHRLSDRHEGRDGRGQTGKGPPNDRS